ncbi:MAG: HypC/HybG/HupF family hydrogenase formation chaperone [Nitrososphaerales archaeon]
MCLAFPGKVVEVKGDIAKIDFGGATTRSDIDISHVQAQEGDYVLVHAGYAIQILDLEEALNMLRYWQENVTWKCERCDIVDECSMGTIVKKINSKSKGIWRFEKV